MTLEIKYLWLNRKINIIHNYNVIEITYSKCFLFILAHILHATKIADPKKQWFKTGI